MAKGFYFGVVSKQAKLLYQIFSLTHSRIYLCQGKNDKGFGREGAYKILDFNSDEGDSILVYKHVFGLDKKVKLKTVASKKTLKKASKTNNPFVYDEKKGFLYFNENGKEKGWGDGGLFVKLQGAPELGINDFTIV